MRIVISEAGEEYRIASDMKIASPNAVMNIPKIEEVIADNRECICIAALNTRNGLIACEVASIGILDGSMVHPREVFEIAINRKAAAIIMIHNHPSGDPSPSAEDICITNQLIEAGKIMDIEVTDHVIVAPPDKYVSLREEAIATF